MAFRLISSFYYKCPVTKGLIGCMFFISASLHAPSLSALRNSITYSFTDIFHKSNWWKLFASKIAPVDVKDLVCCSLLFHSFRIFERRYGSRNYSSYLLSNMVISSLLELFLIYWLQSSSDIRIDALPNGPIAVLFALIVKFFSEIPNSGSVHVFGLPVTMAGLLSGLLFQLTAPFIKIPKSVGDFVYKCFSWADSGPPEESSILMGATLEIQRAQQMEVLEQEMILNSIRQRR